VDHFLQREQQAQEQEQARRKAATQRAAAAPSAHHAAAAGGSFMRVHWVAVPKELRARPVNSWCRCISQSRGSCRWLWRDEGTQRGRCAAAVVGGSTGNPGVIILHAVHVDGMFAMPRLFCHETEDGNAWTGWCDPSLQLHGLAAAGAFQHEA
jgi:hypothetical protein